PEPSNVSDDSEVFLQCGETIFQMSANRIRSFDQVLILQNVDSGSTSGADDWVSSKCASVLTDCKRTHDLVRADCDANGQATGDAFSQAYDVGDYVEVLASELFPGSSKPGLDLIGYK